MAGHGVDAERVHDPHHVGALGLQRRVAALPGVAAVEQQHPARPLGADRVDQRRQPVEPADPAVGLGQRLEVGRGQRIGVVAAAADLEGLQQLLAHDMRRQAARLADAEIDRRLAEIDRHELGVQVGEIEQRELAGRLEAQQIGLRRPAALRKSRSGHAKSCRRRGNLQQLTAAEYGHAQPTSILLSAVQLCFWSSVQVNLSVPLSSTRTKNDMYGLAAIAGSSLAVITGLPL